MGAYEEMCAAQAILDDPALVLSLAHTAAHACMPAVTSEADFERAVRDLTVRFQTTLAVRVAQKVELTLCVAVEQRDDAYVAFTVAAETEAMSDAAPSPNAAVSSLLQRLANTFARRG